MNRPGKAAEPLDLIAYPHTNSRQYIQPGVRDFCQENDHEYRSPSSLRFPLAPTFTRIETPWQGHQDR